MQRPKLAISFSGGRTSAMMTYLCLKKYDATHDILITFANTGCEHEETLRFVDAVDKNFTGGRVVWIEAIIGPKGVGPRAKIVDFKTASRNGEPFEDAIKKHGIFNRSFPNCTGRIKSDPIHYYLRDQGWLPGEYDTAVGIRADEVDRISKNAAKNRIIYPLVQERITKQDVKRFMSQFDWDLKLPGEHYGNCVWCWKKSRRKLATVAKYNPEFFDFPARMEEQYGHISKGSSQQEQDRTFFRDRTSAKQIVQLGQSGNFKEYVEQNVVQPGLFDDFDEDWDIGGGCGDSCEIGADDFGFENSGDEESE